MDHCTQPHIALMPSLHWEKSIDLSYRSSHVLKFRRSFDIADVLVEESALSLDEKIDIVNS